MIAVQRFLCVLLLSLPAIIRPGVAQNQQPSPTDPPAATHAPAVVFDVLVRQRDTGRVVTGLEKDDFTVLENGIKQEVTQFSRADLPLSIMLLLDLSRSMEMLLKRLREGSREAWQHLRPEDEVAVMAFAKEIRVLQGFTHDRRVIAEQIEKTYVEDNRLGRMRTNLHDAVYEAANYLRASANPAHRRMLVIISDNMPNQEGGHSQKEALKELLAAGVIVHGLVVIDPPITRLLNEGSIPEYAQQTGGFVLNVEKSSLAYLNKLEIRDSLTTLLESLHGRYRLAYVPAAAPDDKFRRIQVKLSATAGKGLGKLDVLNRAGYYPSSEKAKNQPQK